MSSIGNDMIGWIPYVSASDPTNPRYKEILQKYGAADFRNVVQRGIEKDFIERTAALLSVAERSVIFRSISGLNTIMERSANGGVIVQYPIDGPTGNMGRQTVNGPLIPKTITLDRANVTYNIMHEALLEGGSLAENDSVMEGAEQLGAKMDNHMLVELDDKSLAANDFTAAATWISTGDVYADINKMINNIVENSGINPNAKVDKWFTVIAPIQAREALEKITIVDGIKIGLSELISQRLGAQIIYTRPPFNLQDLTVWPVTDKAIVIPTQDRHVGKFYTFNGRDLPSIFTTVDENGKRVSTNSWMKFAVTPSESDGSLTENRRIGVIATVA